MFHDGKKIKYSCIQSLKEAGAPVIIVTLPEEAEAIANACRENDIIFKTYYNEFKIAYLISLIASISIQNQ